jgi:tripartite-type tricarboxylate transporter receptor subunit TctC
MHDAPEQTTSKPAELIARARSWLLLVSSLALAIAAPAIADAESFPNRPVTVVVPTGPGGGIDNFARIIAPKMEQRLGKPFVIENRPGAGTTIGATVVARSEPDGHTLLLATSSTLAINVSIYKSLPYDPAKDFMPVLLYARVPFVLVVNPALPVQSAEDLIKLAKAKPGTLSFGSAGIGTATHLFVELLKSQTGIQVTHVPYKSTVQPLNDVVGGHLQFMFSDLPPLLGLIGAGKLRALGVSSRTRVATAPDIPPLSEAGVPGYEAVAWLMVVVRAGAPPDVVNKLHAELKSIVALPEVEQQIKQLGFIPVDSPPPEELQGYIKSEIVRWGKVVQQAGATGIE